MRDASLTDFCRPTQKTKHEWKSCVQAWEAVSVSLWFELNTHTSFFEWYFCLVKVVVLTTSFAQQETLCKECKICSSGSLLTACFTEICLEEEEWKSPLPSWWPCDGGVPGKRTMGPAQGQGGHSGGRWGNSGSRATGADGGWGKGYIFQHLVANFKMNKAKPILGYPRQCTDHTCRTVLFLCMNTVK